MRPGVWAQAHRPLLWQLLGASHWPQLPPQPSSPQLLPVQSATQLVTQTPGGVQDSPAGQLPQLPPQPSTPQLRPSQLGVQSAASE